MQPYIDLQLELGFIPHAVAGVMAWAFVAGPMTTRVSRQCTVERGMDSLIVIENLSSDYQSSPLSFVTSRRRGS
jgi:hypothetical protein